MTKGLRRPPETHEGAYTSRYKGQRMELRVQREAPKTLEGENKIRYQRQAAKRWQGEAKLEG